MTTITVILPFPPAILSPNRRDHWRKKLPFKQEMRNTCFEIGQQNPLPPLKGKKRIFTKLMFYTPHRRWDDDNLLGAMKSGLDGLANGWKVNDRSFRPILLDDALDKANPRVEVTVELL